MDSAQNYALDAEVDGAKHNGHVRASQEGLDSTLKSAERITDKWIAWSDRHPVYVVLLILLVAWWIRESRLAKADEVRLRQEYADTRAAAQGRPQNRQNS